MTLEQLQARLDALSQGGHERAIRAALERAGLRGTREAKRSLTKSGRQRTGLLRSSIRHTVTMGKDGAVEMTLAAGSAIGGVSVKYAALQEYGSDGLPGGVIVPKKGKYLAIPTEDALTGAGVDRWGGPRNYPGELEFIALQQHGPGAQGQTRLLVDKETGEAMYHLVRSVRVKGRHYMRDGMATARDRLGADIVKNLREALTSAGPQPPKAV